MFGGEKFRFTYPDGNRVEYLIFMFECVVESGELEAVDGESAELQYFPTSSLPKLAIPYPKEISSHLLRNGHFFNKGSGTNEGCRVLGVYSRHLV